VIAARIVGREQLAAVARDLKRAPHRLRQELTQSLKDAAEPVKRDVQQAIQTLSIKGQRIPGAKRRFTKIMPGTGIRRRIARVVEVDVSTSAGNPRARFVVRAERLGNASNVPYHLDSGRLRHPLMGDREHWANQWATPTGWFYKTITDRRPKFEDEADKALDRTREAIERGQV
jgi:hypothetical protein